MKTKITLSELGNPFNKVRRVERPASNIGKDVFAITAPEERKPIERRDLKAAARPAKPQHPFIWGW
jgi:hypothetical protein